LLTAGQTRVTPGVGITNASVNARLRAWIASPWARLSEVTLRVTRDDLTRHERAAGL